MKSVIPYLSFGPRTEAALMFYAEALAGQVTTLMRVGDVMKDAAEAQRQDVLHAELVAGTSRLMATGCTPPGAAPPASSPSIALAIDCDSAEEQDRLWARLSDGGTVKLALHDTFYGGRMGAIVDRFGAEWLLNFVPEKR